MSNEPPKGKASPKRPVLSAISAGVTPIIFLSFAGAAIQITEADENTALLYQLIAFTLAFLAGCLRVKFSKYFDFRDIGFRLPEEGHFKKLLFFTPVLPVIALIAAPGPVALTPAYILLAFLFTLSVGFCEELYYRGLVYNYLLKYGILRALVFSSVIFGIGHMANLFGGYSPVYVTVQIIFAFTFGFTACLILIAQKSLWPLIIWHFIHDFLSYISNEPADDSALVLLSAAGAIILLAYAIYLFVTLKISGRGAY